MSLILHSASLAPILDITSGVGYTGTFCIGAAQEELLHLPSCRTKATRLAGESTVAVDEIA